MSLASLYSFMNLILVTVSYIEKWYLKKSMPKTVHFCMMINFLFQDTVF